MLKIKEYVKAESMEHAWELNQKRSAKILGGMLWLKMSSQNIQTAVDLSGLGLDQIEETEDAFTIGCMVTLRQMELHPGLAAYTAGAMAESVRHIVGVQFRNLATVGGSLFGRYGFSDVLTMLLALDVEVELYKGGRMSLADFAKRPINRDDRDILVRVIIHKTPLKCIYLSHRNTRTDFPVLTCALTCFANSGWAVVGARPARARRYPLPEELCSGLWKGNAAAGEIAACAEDLSRQILMESNMRASAAYRTHLAEVLIRRELTGLQDIKKGGGVK